MSLFCSLDVLCNELNRFGSLFYGTTRDKDENGFRY